jgi:nucleotide-binding universal stress UspA family protein
MSTVSNTRVSIFDRIVCAFDGSPGSLDAAVQAEALRHGLGAIELVGVVEVSAVVYPSYGAPLIVADAQRAFADRFEKGRSVCPDVSAEVLEGPVIPRLLERIKDAHATLVAVGATDHSRPVGIVLGSVSTTMLHRAPCSVLVARRPWQAGACPGSLVVGYDGSLGASEALSAGRDLAARFDARLRVVLAGDVASIEADELDGLTIERDDRDPVDALREASQSADLLLVGSRGLRGLKAIGSVSEQLGHQSACSILIVRDAPGR